MVINLSYLQIICIRLTKTKPSALNSVASKVNKNKPLAINRMMANSEKFCPRNRSGKKWVESSKKIKGSKCSMNC